MATTNIFVARFPGQCAADCGEPVKPGDQCVYVPVDDIDAPATYAHYECQKDAAVDVTTRASSSQKWGKPCTHCFMALPLTGVCDCRD